MKRSLQSRRSRAAALLASAAMLAGLAAAPTATAAAPTALAVTAPTSAAATTAAPTAGGAYGSIAPTAAPVVPGRGNTAANLFQWTWNAVAAECTRTLGPNGYAYVQVSPPQEHVQGGAWWTSYQPVSYRLESKLGTRAEFAAMVDTCGDAGVKIIADTVINHMAGADSSGTGSGGSSYGVDSFPGLYGRNDFNDCRSNISNYGDRWQVQHCRLVSLQDLRTGSDYVRTKIADYMNDLIGLGVAGFRIDASKHMPAADLEAIKAKLTDRNVFWVHEVIGSAGEPIQPSEYLGSGDSHEFQYARNLAGYFDGNIAGIRGISNGLLASDRAGVFVDNHDTERDTHGTMNYRWGAKYVLGNVFLLGYDYGWPTVYSGYRFTDRDAGAPMSGGRVQDASCANTAVWTCTHDWTEIAGMVGFRNAVGSAPVTRWWDNGANAIGFGRGDRGYVAINNRGSTLQQTFQTSLPAGTYCDVVASRTCATTVTVDYSGRFAAQIPQYGALAIHVGARTGGGPTEPTDPAQATTVFYSTNQGWAAPRIHYRVGSGAWTTAPGETLAPACAGWVKRTVTTGGQPITAAFNNGSGTWDNNGGSDYRLTGAVAAVKDGRVTASDPCAGGSPDSTTVFYATDRGWSDSHVHYRVGSGAWTEVPGERLAPACAGWVSRTLASGGQPITAAFTNGSGSWDNNGGADYRLTGTHVAVRGGQATAGNPCP
jgi:alpha-amylase